MIFCFGISWPFSIYHTWRTKTVRGKSIIFLSFVLIGYIAGIIHKLRYTPDLVTILYVFNALLVAIDIMLYLKYRKNT